MRSCANGQPACDTTLDVVHLLTYVSDVRHPAASKKLLFGYLWTVLRDSADLRRHPLQRRSHEQRRRRITRHTVRAATHHRRLRACMHHGRLFNPANRGAAHNLKTK